MLFPGMDRPDVRRAYLDGQWRTIRVLRILPAGRIKVARFNPKRGWVPLPKAIRLDETKPIKPTG